MKGTFMKATICAVVFSVFSFSSLFSQDLQSAIKLFKSEQFAASSSAFKKLLSQTPNDGDIYFYYGVSFLRKFQADTVNTSFSDISDSAKAIFELGKKRDPRNPLNYVGLGGFSLFLRDIPKAEQYFAKATSLLPSKANMNIVMMPEKQCVVLYNIAEAYIRSGTHDTAKVFSLLRKAEQLYKQDPQLYIVIGDAYIFMRNAGSKAIVNYNIAQDLDPGSPEAKLRVGQLWMRAKNYPDALNTYKEVVRIDSTFAPAYRELGYLYSRANRNTEAQLNYKKFLELSANNTAARKQYVNTLIELKKYPEAIKELQDVIKVDTMDNDVNRALAYCYFETGQYDQGLIYSKKFFSNANPEKIRATDYAYLGRLLAKSKQDSLAYETLMKAFQLDTSKSELLSEAGASLMRVRNYQKAIDVYQMKLDLKKMNSLDYIQIGRAYFYLANYVMADSMFSIFNTRQPDHIQGWVFRARSKSYLDAKDFKDYNSTGFAKPYYEIVLEKTQSDSARYVKERFEAIDYLAYYYLGQYYNYSKSYEDGRKALYYYTRMISLNLADEEKTKSIKKVIEALKLKLL